MNIVKFNRKKVLEVITLALLSIMIWIFYCRHTIFTLPDASFYDFLTTVKIALLVVLLIVMIIKIAYGDYGVLFAIIASFLIVFVAILSYERELLYFADYDLNCDILIYVIFCIVCKDINYRKIIKTAFLVQVLISLLFLLDILLNNVNNFLQFRGTSFRYSLGRSASAEFSFIVYYIVLYYCYLRNKFIKKNELLVLFVLVVATYYLTNTRLNFLLAIMFLLLMIAIRFLGANCLNKMTCILMTIFVVIVPICYLYLSYIYDSDNAFLVKINELLSGRLSLNQNILYYYGLSLFSNDFIPTMQKGFYDVVDSGFLSILFDYGILFYLILISSLVYFTYMIYKNNDKYLFIAFAFSVFDMVFNHSIRYFQFNFLFFILSYKYSIFSHEETN